MIMIQNGMVANCYHVYVHRPENIFLEPPAPLHLIAYLFPRLTLSQQVVEHDASLTALSNAQSLKALEDFLCADV
jgi:hypothetical protein